MPTLAGVTRHVIVLMLENRSFDHMLGDIAGISDLTGAEWNRHSDGSKIPVTADADYDLAVGPSHSHADILAQLVDDNGGFVLDYARYLSRKGKPEDAQDKVMRCFAASRVPVSGDLARNFVTFRRWFASVPGETWPNRNYAHAATSDGEVNIRFRAYRNRTIFKVLENAGKSWRIYHRGLPQTLAFPQLWLRPFRHRFSDINRLFHAIDHDALDAYSFVEPNHGLLHPFKHTSNNQHPDNNTMAKDLGRDFKAAEQLIADIYNRLKANPAVFSKTVFLITYDEHGGFHDHHVPPAATPPGDKGWNHDGQHFGFDRLGVRVPAVLVSPWLAPAVVDEGDWDHSSIPRSLRELFAPGEDPLTARDRNAPGFHDLRTLDEFRTDLPTVAPAALLPFEEHLADLKVVARTLLASKPELDEFQKSLVSLAGAVEQILDEEERGVGELTADTEFPDAEDAEDRFGTLGALTEYFEYVTNRFRASVDPGVFEMLQEDGGILRQPASYQVRAAIGDLLAERPGAGTSVTILASHELMLRVMPDGTVMRTDLETGFTSKDDEVQLMAAGLTLEDRASAITDHLFRLLGQEPMPI